MAPRRNDAPTDASYVGDILDFTDEAVLVTLNHVRTLYLNMRVHQERKVKVAERDRVAMQALLPFIRDLDYTVRQTRPTESWITEARNMALNAVLVAFPRSRNTTASRRPGLDTTWLLMTRRLRGAWDPSRAFPITLLSPPPTTPKPGTAHPPPRPVFSARSASPVAGPSSLLRTPAPARSVLGSPVQILTPRRRAAESRIDLFGSSNSSVLGRDGRLLSVEEITDRNFLLTFTPSPTPPPTDAGAQEAFASLSRYRMDQLAENPLQFMQDWAALTAPTTEQRDPRLQRAIDAYGVLELRERLAREAENAAIMLPLAETVGEWRTRLEPLPVTATPPPSPASSVASSSSSSSSDSKIHFYRPLPRGYIPSYLQRPDEDYKTFCERLARTQF
ncbi:hypothetical protein VKT23_014189 [Stygiomarasmius scandens]|uniref:Uncharacterized protein n=1 Tax=Marasmiellus scandens TaxID=2682957 RepID=A0ABR1J3I7_9AGAR